MVESIGRLGECFDCLRRNIDWDVFLFSSSTLS